MTPSNQGTPGQRLPATIVDDLARSNPTHKLGIIPSNDGFREITAREVTDAVNATAWWLETKIGKAQHPETITYMGANDIRYLTFVLAAHKTGYKPLLISTRLSDDAYSHLLTICECDKFFYTKEKQRRISEIQTFRQNTAFFEVDIVGQDEPRPYPWAKEYAECEDEVALIIHSSGTTGMPKPVPLTHGFWGTIDHNAHLPNPRGRQSSFFNDLSPNNLVLCTTPFFHLMGFLSLAASIFHNVPFAILPDKPLSVQLIAETVKKARPTAALLPPSILEDMSQSEIGIETLKGLDYVYFGGAPLATETGNQISQYTKLISVLGSTEMGLICSFVPEDPKNWSYFEWNEAYGVKMDDAGEGTYELVIPRHKEMDSRMVLGIFHTFPQEAEYRSNDLFVQHPDNPRLWKYHGRRDDVIVLSNGEKLNPVTLEKAVEGHRKVRRAVLIGQARFQTALLVEPDWNGQSLDEKAFVEEIWPIVNKANESVPNYGRVTKSKIALAKREKPFRVTPKGTTQRRMVNQDYEEEIEAIYAADDLEENSVPLPEIIQIESLTAYVRQTVCSLIGRKDIKDDEDFYNIGLDSLQVIQLARTLEKTVSSRKPDAKSISAQDVYANPSISQLAQFLLRNLTGQSTTSVSRVDRINNIVSKFAASIPQRSQLSTENASAQTAILTGSTGSLGTYLLDRLVNNKNVEKVYCLNRSDAASRQVVSFEEKGLDTTQLKNTNKVEFLQVSFGEDHFGLPDEKYQSLLHTVTLIIHNAWAVNFNIPMESFENPHIRGLSNFIDFSVASKHNAHLSFVSSVSTIGAWTAEMGPVVPEVAFEDCKPVMQQGYGESKHASERLCLEASRKSGVPTTVLRVGQVAGPTTEEGVWNKQEWLPTLVATSKALGKVPETLGNYDIDWIPVDTLATITIELLENRASQASNDSAVFHLMNPCKTTWQSIVPAVQEAYNTPSVPIQDWIAELEAIKNPSDEDVRQKPALKLLGFYRGLASGQGMLSADIDKTKTKAASKTMATLKPIGKGHMVNWIRQWDF